MKRLLVVVGVVNVILAIIVALASWRLGYDSREDVGTALFMAGGLVGALGVVIMFGAVRMTANPVNLWTIGKLPAEDQRAVLDAEVDEVRESSQFAMWAVLSG